MLVEYGMRFSTSDHFYFITLTWRQGKGLQRTAPSVREDWRVLLLWLNSNYPQTKWVRALELTVQKQPHLHLILSFGPGNKLRARCERKAKYDARWRRKICDCLEHRLSGVWNSIVPDSYVVDVRDAEKDDAGYLAKYVGKANQITADLVELGFTRTWSRSRSWPVERFQLVPTVEKSWKKISASYPGDWKELKHNTMTSSQWAAWTEENPFPSIGTDLNWEMEVERENQRLVSTMKGLRKEILGFDNQKANNNNEVGPSGVGSRDGVLASARGNVSVGGDRGAARHRSRGSTYERVNGLRVFRRTGSRKRP